MARLKDSKKCMSRRAASCTAWELQELARVTVTRLRSTRDATMSCIADLSPRSRQRYANNKHGSRLIRLRPAFEGTPRCRAESIIEHAQRHAPRQVACRQQMFQTYEQTSLPPLPSWCAQAAARLVLRPHGWAIARNQPRSFMRSLNDVAAIV